jgi:hypothetical protein
MPDVRGSTWRLLPRAAIASVVVLGASSPAAASQVATVDLQSHVGTIDGAVPGGPAFLSFGVTNLGVTEATGVSLELELPPGVAVVELVDATGADCAVTPGPTGSTVACGLAAVPINHSFGFELYLEFDETGTYELTASATADQSDLDGSAASTTVAVVDEVADLWGGAPYEPLQVRLGEEVQVLLGFGTDGPTAAAGATITGSFPAGATVVPGSFFYGSWADASPSTCTVTATGFTCAGAWASAVGGVHQHVSYRIIPEAPGPMEATATIAGRNDPDHSNDVSTYSIEVVPPLAELLAFLTPVAGAWIGEQTRDVSMGVLSLGDLAAQDVAVELEVPPGWTVGLPAGPDPTGRTCAVGPDEQSVTCTFDEVAALVGEIALTVPVTSPPGPAASGTATVTATTTTPEGSDYFNTDSKLLLHRLTPLVPAVVVTPSTGVQDGGTVVVQVVDFPAVSDIVTLQCVGGAEPSLATCDIQTLLFSTVDLGGAATLTRNVRRFLVVDAGLVDCAVEACLVAASGFGTDPVTAAAPIAFAEPPDTGLSVAIGDDAYTSADSRSAATVAAVVSCDVAMQVALQFELVQLDASGPPPRRGASIVTAPCTPGAPVEMSSDLIGAMDPGVAELAIRAASGSHRAAASGLVELASSSAQMAELQARLADPDDTTVMAELVAALLFRIEHNPVWALDFWRAVLSVAR